MTQPTYGAPPPGYGYGQPPQQQYQQPQYAPPVAPAAFTIDGQSEIKQTGTPQGPKFTDLLGRVVYIFPKSVDESNPQYGPKIIADVLFLGAPITHSVKDGQAIPLLPEPAMPGVIYPDMWITATRIVNGLRNGFIGKHLGRRVAKDGNAFVLQPISEAENVELSAAVGRAKQARAQQAHASNPLAQHQSPAAAVAQASGYAPQVPPAGAVAQVAGQQFTATGQGPFPGQPYPPQGMPPQQPPTPGPENPGPGGTGQFDPATWAAGQQWAQGVQPPPQQ